MLHKKVEVAINTKTSTLSYVEIKILQEVNDTTALMSFEKSKCIIKNYFSLEISNNCIAITFLYMFRYKDTFSKL